MIASFYSVCWAEGLKLRRSKAPLMSAAAYAMAPVAAAILLLAPLDPSRARLYRYMTIASEIAETHADWARYFELIARASAVGGLIVFSLFVIWIFGREHADRTSRELMTLPVPREMLAGGKIMVAALWCLALQLGMALLALLVGACLGLPGWSSDALASGMGKVFSVAFMTFCLAIPFGFIANLSRGTMAAVGALFFCLFFAALMSALGWDAFFPWSIPSAYSDLSPSAAFHMDYFSLSLVLGTGAAGIIASMIWWRRADHH